MFQDVLGCFRLFGAVSSCFRVFPGVSGCFKLFQDVSGCQEAPGSSLESSPAARHLYGGSPPAQPVSLVTRLE